MTGASRASARRLVLAASLAAVAAAGFGEVRYEAELEPAVVGLAELVTLTVRASSSGFGGVGFEATFELDNLEVVGGPSQSQAQQWINGKTSSSRTLTWRLRPVTIGKARVRALVVGADAGQIALPDQQIDVVQEAPPGRAAGPSEPFDPFAGLFDRGQRARRPRAIANPQPKLLLAAEVEPRDPVVGQRAIWRLVLYTQADIHSFDPESLPSFRGFWVREIPQASSLRPTWVERDGARFGRVVMLERALYPLAPGTITIEPMRVEVVARTEVDFFGSPMARPTPLRLATEPIELRVRPLPSPPDDFCGVVGQVDLAATFDRPTIEVGQAATLRLRLKGTGNLQAATSPAMPVPDGLRAFPGAEAADSGEERGASPESERLFQLVVVGDRPGIYELPPITTTYFDPEGQTFRHAASQPLRLEVRPAAAVVAVAPPDPPSPESEPTSTLVGRTSRTIVLWGAAGLAAAAIGVGAVGLARRPAVSGSTRGRRRALSDRLRAAAGEAGPRARAAATEEAWRRFLDERWGVGPGVPTTQWRERLGAAGVAEALASRLVELADELHYLRYAPELSSPEELWREVARRSRELERAVR